MDTEPVVFVVDDDPAMRESLRWLVESVSIEVETFDNARAFLDRYEPGQLGCLVLDVRMPGMGGLDLLDKLEVEGITLSVIIITGHGDVSTAVRAMKAGAIDFIEKPFSDQTLLDRIQQAIETHRTCLRRRSTRNEVIERMGRLSPRERDVMSRVVMGRSNKTVAADLGLSPKTVEVHRSRVMEKMQAKSLPELVRLDIASREPGECPLVDSRVSPVKGTPSLALG